MNLLYVKSLFRVLQCVAVCCSVLQCVAVCCSVLQCGAVFCSVLHNDMNLLYVMSLFFILFIVYFTHLIHVQGLFHWCV